MMSYNPKNPNDKILPFNISCLNQFPFIDDTFDSITLWEQYEKMGGKINEIISFINNLLNQKIDDYMINLINDLFADITYKAQSETLILNIEKKEE